MFKKLFSGKGVIKGALTAGIGIFLQGAALRALEVANTLFRGENEEIIKEKAAAIAIQRLGVSEAFGGALAEVVYEGVLWALERVNARIERGDGFSV